MSEDANKEYQAEVETPLEELIKDKVSVTKLTRAGHNPKHTDAINKLRIAIKELVDDVSMKPEKLQCLVMDGDSVSLIYSHGMMVKAETFSLVKETTN